KTRRVWDSRSTSAVHRCSVYGLKDCFFKSIAHGANVCFSLRRVLGCAVGGFSQTNDRCDIFCSPTAPVFLAATQDQRAKTRPSIDINRADTFWSMKFVRGQRKEIDRRIAEADRDFPDCLHGISVKEHTFLAAYLRNL